MSETELHRIERVYAGYEAAQRGADRWSPANAGNRQIGDERAALVGALLHRYGYAPLGGRRVLDIGCGSGDVLWGFTAWGAQPQQLYGLELLGARAAAAHARHPELPILQGNAAALGFDAAAFDLILFFTVFSSVLDDGLRQDMAAEALRVLKPGGAIVWYDLRMPNPGNREIRPLSRTTIQALFPTLTPHLQTTTVLPPLARRLGRATGALYPLLSRLAWLRTHYVGLLIREL